VMGDMVNVKTNQPILQGEINDPAIENDGGGYVDPAGSIGTNSDPNWMNDGAFDDIGSGIDPKTGNPWKGGLSFSSDNGVAGNLYYDPLYYSKPGNNAAFWNTAFSIFNVIINGLKDNTALDGISFSGDSFKALVKLTQSLASGQFLVLYVDENGAVGLGIFGVTNNASTHNQLGTGILLHGSTLDIWFTGYGLGFASYQWMQNVSRYNYLTGSATYGLDGDLDGNPFYYNQGNLAEHTADAITLGYDAKVQDVPGFDYPGSFVGNMTLIGRDSNGLGTFLGTFVWGFVYGGGSGPTTPGPVYFNPVEPSTQQGALNDYNSYP